MYDNLGAKTNMYHGAKINICYNTSGRGICNISNNIVSIILTTISLNGIPATMYQNIVSIILTTISLNGIPATMYPNIIYNGQVPTLI